MRFKHLGWALIAVVLVSGCVSYGGYTPVVDPYGDARADRIDQDLYECQYLAREAYHYHPDDVAHGAVMGGLMGAIAGTFFGAVAGDPGTGMAVGATVGAMSGGLHAEMTAEERYVWAYRNCMRNRGHNVVN